MMDEVREMLLSDAMRTSFLYNKYRKRWKGAFFVVSALLLISITIFMVG